MTTADVTRRALSLGAQDTTTGWYAKSFSETTIKMIILPKGSSIIGLPTGNYAKYEHTGFTANTVAEGDEIKDANGSYYEIETVEEAWWLDAFSHFICGLSKMPMHYDRPATSGTWHLDSDSLKTDVRYRQRLFLSDHLSSADITKDDASQATYITAFSNADYPITKVFVTKGVDLIFSVDSGESEGLVGHDKSAYAYHESVPIDLFAINKTGITATNLIEKGYQELRRILESYPTGSVRRMGRMTETTRSLGSPLLFSQKCMVEYTRAKA
jgi:hypothetical protein